MRTRPIVAALSLIFLTLSLSAQNNAGSYFIKSGDTLSVAVFKEPSLSTTVVVRDNGKVSLPLLQDVPADGLTISELTTLVEGRYGKYLKTPHVAIQVVK